MLVVNRAVALILALVAATPHAAPHGFHSSIQPLSAAVRAELKHNGYWHSGCPVGFSSLRVLTVTYRGFDKQTHSGQLVVNQAAAAPLARVFHQLYAHHFPIRHMSLDDMYGPVRAQPKDGDVTGSFSCRQ